MGMSKVGSKATKENGWLALRRRLFRDLFENGPGHRPVRRDQLWNINLRVKTRRGARAARRAGNPSGSFFDVNFDAQAEVLGEGVLFHELLLLVFNLRSRQLDAQSRHQISPKILIFEAPARF